MTVEELPQPSSEPDSAKAEIAAGTSAQPKALKPEGGGTSLDDLNSAPPQPSEPDAASVGSWPYWYKSPGASIDDAHKELFYAFTQWLKVYASDVWCGKKGLTLDNANHKNLRNSLVLELSRNAEEEVLLCDWWDRIIAKGHELALWKILLLSKVVIYKPLSAKFTRLDFQLLHGYRAMEQRWERDLLGDTYSQNLADMVIVSAIFNGGMTSVPMLMAVAQLRASRVIVCGQQVIVALEVPRTDDTLGHQIWYPDGVTSVLLLRWIESGAGSLSIGAAKSPSDVLKRALHVLRDIFKRLGLKQASSSLPTVRQFLRAARVAHGLQLCGHNEAYLAGDIACQSLSWTAFCRLRGIGHTEFPQDKAHSWKLPATRNARRESLPESQEHVTFSNHGPVGNGGLEDVLVHRDPNETRRALANNFESQGAEAPLLSNTFDPLAPEVSQITILRQMRYVLNKEGALENMKVLIDSRGSAWWPVVYQLACWVRWLLGAPIQENNLTSARSKVRQSTAYRYLSAIARHLIILVGSEDLMQLDVEDIEYFYEQCCERITSSDERAYFWLCIRMFHQFLVLHGAPEISFDELDGYIGARVATTAVNIVGEHEFAVFKSQVLLQKPKVGSALMMMLLVAILGFRLGLRRREVQMLWVHNFHPGPFPMLKVRASFLGTLKSQSAKRMLDLTLLIPPDELALLTEHCAMRKSEMNGLQGLIFCSPDMPRVPLAQSVLFDPITQCFQRILGSDGPVFRFHHFRHSFATWTFVKMSIADNTALMGADAQWLERCGVTVAGAKAFKERLYPRLVGMQEPLTRRNLHVLASMLGHLSPLTTLKYYIHLLDWICAAEVDFALRERVAHWSLDDVRRVCTLSESMPRKPPYKSCKDDRLQFLRLHVSHRPCDLISRPVLSEGDPSAPSLAPLLTLSLSAPTPGPERLLLLMSIAVRVMNEWWIASNQVMNAQSAINGVSPDPTMISLLEKRSQAAREHMDAYMRRLEQAQAMPSEWVAQACVRYRLVTAPRNEALVPRQFLSLPRLKSDRTEFWKIIDSTVDGFHKFSVRCDLVLTAKRMLERKGPQSGNLSFHQNFEELPRILNGLIAMGLNLQDMEFTVKFAGNDTNAFGKSIQANDLPGGILKAAVETLMHKGVAMRHWTDASKQSLPANGLLTLHFVTQRCWPIRAVNYASIWILFAEQYMSSSDRDGCLGN